MAFAKSKTHDSFYNESESMIYTLYEKIFKNYSRGITPAPSWRLLEKFGGNMSILEFRQSFEKIIFNNIDDYIHSTPACRLIGRLYEKKIKF